MIKNYAKALTQLINEGFDLEAALKNLDALLKQRGHQNIKAQVLTQAQKDLERSSLENTAVISLSKAEDQKKLEKDIRAALAKLEADHATAVVINPTNIGGFKIKHKGQIIDASYKSKLLELYRTITRN